MKLWVRVVEARRLRARDLNGSSDPYVRVKIADKKFRTKTVKKSLYPYWGEEFTFEINDLDDDLLIYVMDQDKFFKNDLVGRLQFNVEMVYDSPNKSLGTKWYDLHPKSKKSKRKDCGEILLSVLFSEDNPFLGEVSSSSIRNHAARHLDRYADQASESSSVSLSDILGLPIISPSMSSSSPEEEKPYSEVFTPRPTQGNAQTTSTTRMARSMPGSPETPKFKMHSRNGYESNVNGQHSRSAPGSPETPKFKMRSHNVYESNSNGHHSRSVPGSPDSIAEMIVCTILVLQVQRALPIISRFMQARVQQGSDHGVKGQGDGWVLTIALIEGSTLAAVDSTGFSDPYVIFT